MMAAGYASMYGADVTLLEKMPRPGRKILISGKGRCNLTNACDVNTFMENVPVNNKFLSVHVGIFALEFFYRRQTPISKDSVHALRVVTLIN